MISFNGSSPGVLNFPNSVTNTVPHIVVTLNRKIILLLFQNVIFSAVIGHNVNDLICDLCGGQDPQVESHW